MCVIPALCGAAMGCAPRLLPPPTAPERTVPALLGPLGPLEPGKGRVLVDVVDGPATVSLVDGQTTGEGTVTGPMLFPGPKGPLGGFGTARVSFVQEHRQSLCRSPCPVDLPFGVYPIVLTTPDGRVTNLDLPVQERAMVLRVAMASVNTQSTMKGLGYGVLGGGLGFLVGALVLGIVGAAVPGHPFSDQGFVAAPVTALGVGAALTVGGALLLDHYRTEIRPAALTQFELPQSPKGP